MKFIWAEKKRKTALPPPKNTNNSLTPPLWAINNKDMKSKDFLRSKGILSNDSDHYIIYFHDGREINLGDLLEEYAQQFRSPDMAEALRLKWITLTEDMGRMLSGQRGVSIDKLNKVMNLVQEFVNTLPASLSSPGSGWVKVEDRLPENAGWVNDTVMFWSKKHGHALIGCYDFEFDDWTQQPWTEGAEKLKSSDVTHWRPLPAPPGE